MPNTTICLSVPNFSGNEKKYVNEAIDAEWVSTAGAFISRFEEEMAKTLEGEEAALYTDYAKKLIKSLYDNYAVKDPKVSNGLVLHSTYSNHSPYNTCDHKGVDECNSWGDYFYMEALTRLNKDWELYW